MSSWPGLPQQDDYGFSNSFPQNTGTQPTPSRSSQQNFSTAYTPAQASYYRLQATAAAAADYSNEGYQAQAYGQRQPQQQRPVNDGLSYSTQWYGGGSGNSGRTASSTNESLPNINTINQSAESSSAAGTAGRSSSNRVYDTSGFENLAYASAAVGYATESPPEQRRNQEVSNTGSHYGTRPLPATTDAQSQYTQAYAQPSATSTNSPQYNSYMPQISRPESTDSTASQSTSYSQRQAPASTQQAMQNSRSNAASYPQQQASGYGMQNAKSTPAQSSTGYTARQTPVATTRTNQNMSVDRVAQAARAYAQKQGYYNSTPSANSNLQSPATSTSQRQGVATSNRQAPTNQRQAPTARSPIQMTANVHQQAPSTTSSAPQSSPALHQRQASSSARQAPSNSNHAEARSGTASPRYLGSNPTTQSGSTTNSNIAQRSPGISQQQSLNSRNYNGNTGVVPLNTTNQQSHQNLPASNQTRNPRSLLSPTEASARAYQSRTAGANRQVEAQESQMQTVIDPRDLDLIPRPSPSAILEAAKLMREAEEREAAAAAAKAAETEQAQAASKAVEVAGAPQSTTAARSSNMPSASPNNQSRNASNSTHGNVPGASRMDSQPKGSPSKISAPPNAPQAATSSQAPSQANRSNAGSNPASTPQTATPKRAPVVWPETKKASLASAAITVLMSFAENAGKTITKDQIHAMLDEGPSYIEFCERIEGMGFRMDRARLAKTLLSAVADTVPAALAAAKASAQANSKAKVSGSNRPNTQLTNQTSNSQSQPPLNPWGSGNGHAPTAGARVSLAEPSVGTNGQSEITWRPLDGPSSNAEKSGADGQQVKKRRSRKSAPEIGPDGQIIPPRGRGRPRRDGLPPKPRKSMPAVEPAINPGENQMGSSSSANAHPFSAFSYQPPASTQGPPPLNIDNPRSPLFDQHEASEPPVDDWRARHAQALRERWDSMSDKPRNFPYPETPPAEQNRDVENRLLAALGNGDQNGGMGSDNSVFYGANIPQREGATRDSHSLAPDRNGETSTELSASSSTKRNAPAKSSIHAQQNHQSNSLQEKQQPLTKEMAARKRNFAELIDLTDEHDPSSDAPQKFRRVDNATNENSYYGEGQLPIATLSNNPHAHPLPPSFHDSQRVAGAPGFIKQQHTLLASDSPLASGRNSPNPYDNFADLCKPIDKNLALRKSVYNPTTIARDVLITVNRHPTQRALNAHLEVLKKRFPKQVNSRSDLSTFRWDIVDPGGLPVGSENMLPNEDHKTPIPLPQVQPAVPYSSINQSSPHMGPSENMASSEMPSAFKSPANPISTTPASETFSAFKRPAIPVNTTPARPSSLRNEATGQSAIASASPRGRGRPPKDRTGESSKGPSSLRGDPTANPTPAKKRGRPFKDAESALKAAVKQQRLSTGELQPGRRGRPPKALVEKAKMGNPKYVSFDCEWRNCKAELQNLETLRQHVFTVHGKTLSEDGIRCQWINCGKKAEVVDEETGESQTVHHDLLLPDLEKFKKHVEKKHIHAYAWNLGDGPKGSDLDGNETDVTYLSDAHGKQVTPSIADQEVVDDHRHRSDSLTVNKNGEPRKRVGRPPKNKTVAQSSEENVMGEASRDSSVAARSAS